PVPAVTANRRFLYCKILGAKSHRSIASPLPSQSASGPPTWLWATPNPVKTGSKGWMLPIPATYVLDSTGRVVLSYLDADYTTRLEPTEITVALTHLRAARIPARNNR